MVCFRSPALDFISILVMIAFVILMTLAVYTHMKQMEIFHEIHEEPRL